MLIRSRRDFIKTAFGVAGAAGVLGKFGEMPAYALNPSNNQPYHALGGTLIPTSSVTQYAANMATWLGVDSASLPIVCPTIGNFQNAQNLGFLG